MARIRTIVLGLVVGVATTAFAGAALAACDSSGSGSATTFNCSATGINVRVDTGPDFTLGVVDMTIEGTDDSTGYITFHNNSGIPADLTLNIENTSIDSPAYLGVFAATGDINPDDAPGDLTLTIDEASSITAWDAGIYARAYDGGDVSVENYGEIFAGTIGEEQIFGGVGISAVADAGSVWIDNHGDVTSYSGRGLYADGGYADGSLVVSIDNDGAVEAYGDAIRAIAGGSFGASTEIVNNGTVIGHDRRGIIGWSASGHSSIYNYGNVTSYGGQAIYGSTETGNVTIVNDAQVRVIDEDPDVADGNDTSFAGIEAEAGTSGDIDVQNLEDGDILSYDHGIYAHTASGKVTIANDGLIVSAKAGILTSSTLGDVTIDNAGTIRGGDADETGAVAVVALDVGVVQINNKVGGVIVADTASVFTPTTEWLDGASLTDLEDLAQSAATRNAITTLINGADSVTATNDGTVVGTIALGSFGGGDLGTARIENNGLWVTGGISGMNDSDGVIANTGRIHSLGVSVFYGNVENSGDIVLNSLGEDIEGYGSGALVVSGDYDGSGDARLVFDWPDGSLVGIAPSLSVFGDVTGTTEMVIGRGEALATFEWDGTPMIALVSVAGTTENGADSFQMDDLSYGILSFRLVHEEGDGSTWYLALDAVDGAETLAEIPFAARNLFKLATEGVADRLDDLRNVYAGNGTTGAPLGYAATPDDPVTAALALNQPAQPTINAWVKTTGRYGQGQSYDAISGVIEAGVDTLVDTGSGTATIGAFGGYGGSEVDFDLDDSRATLTGPLVGAYANYTTGRAFFGAIAAVQSLDVEATLSGADTSFGGITYGGRIDAGYRFGDELIIEPVVALAASRTQFDTFDMNAMDVGFVDADSLATEARLRIAREFGFDGVVVVPFAIATVGYDFLGGDGVDVPPTEVVLGNNGGAYGELAGGVTVASDDGMLSGFAKGNLGYAAGEVSAGIKLGANAAF
jgi:hypothetical protein